MRQWLDYLAKRYNGTLHSPDLTLDDDVFVPQVAPTWQREADHSGTEDEVIEIKVKSEETLINEQYKRAQIAGNVVSLTSMTTSASSIRSTFNSISATVTALRHGPSSKLQERNVSVKSESPMISYKATRMILTSDSNGTDKFSIARNEGANGRKIDVSIHPFAQGGLRNVYRMRQESISGTLLQVAKESRHAIKYQERLKFHLETVKCQEQAASYANWFNNQILRMEQEQQKKNQMHSLPSIPCIEVLRAEVYRLNAPSCPGGFRYLAVEKELGGTYLKWNNNDGYVNSSETIHCHVAQAFRLVFIFLSSSCLQIFLFLQYFLT